MSDSAPNIICPGQGAQAIGMGRVWMDTSPAAKAVFDRADELLGDRFGATLSQICQDGPAETISRTDVSQPAIYVCSIASWHGLTEGAPPTPACTAGLSLGEYTALHLAGAFSFEDGLHLVAERGRLMQETAEASDGSMLAVMGLDPEEAQTLCDDTLEALGGGVLVPANFNAPGQIVLSGDTAACGRANELCGERGHRATPLSVAGAFHSAHMQAAADGLAETLAGVDIQIPSCDVWSNVTAAPHEANADSIRLRLVDQLTSPVRWAQQCAAMIHSGHTDYTELAPGKVLRGLMRRIDRDAKVTSHDEPDPSHAA